MKKISKLIVILMIACISTAQGQDSTIFYSSLEINGVMQEDSILCVKYNAYYGTDARHLVEAANGNYYHYADLFNIHGFATQYGKIISYAHDGLDTGFYKSIPIDMLPPTEKLEYGGNTIQFAPVNFLSKALGDTVFFDASTNTLRALLNPPDTIGCIIPEAAAVANALEQEGYLINQAGMDHTNAITVYNAGYTTDCNGNNAGFPYFIINMPPPATYDTLFSFPMIYNVGADEAIIVIGKTPPKCKYFSFRSYLVSRFYSEPEITRKKLYASMGDASNCYSMNENVAHDDMFERDFAMISAADSNIAYKCKQMIMENSTITEADIHFDIVPGDVFRFGFTPQADWGSFLHRASIFEDADAGNAYINHPTLEVLRVTPANQVLPSFLKPPVLTSRITGHDEFHLNEDFEYMEHAMFEAYSANYDVTFLDPSVWLMEGAQAIQEMANVLGEVRDALYIRTESFNFYEDDIIVVYGVNHANTGKAVYTNVSCYRDTIFAGYGGIKNNQYENTARTYFSDTLVADQFFNYTFARAPIPGDSNVFVVPQDTADNIMGINFGDRAFMAFRAYVDTASNVGPSPQEIIYSRAMLLRPKGSGFSDISDTKHIDINIYPNPITDVADFNITVEKPSHITMSIYSIDGYLIDQPMVDKEIRQTENIRWYVPKNMSSGIYILQLYSIEEGEDRMYCTSKKLVVS